MKKQLSYFMALMMSVFVFVGCSDDKDPGIPIEKELVGTYNSKLNVVVNEMPFAKDVIQNIEVTKAGESQIKLELKDLKLQGLDLGTIAITSDVTKTATGYSFTGNEQITLVVGKCDVTVKGTIVGFQITGDIDVAAEGNINVKVNFTGKKLAGNESAEAKITAFTFENNPLIMGMPKIDDAAGTITFNVVDSIKDTQMSMTPTIVISEKATIQPASGVKQDFSQPVTYTVYAENGTAKVYTVSIPSKSSLQSFENWEDVTDNGITIPFIIPNTWATCNMAVGLIKALGSMAEPAINYTGVDPVTKTEDAYKGKYAARLESIDTKGALMLGTAVPRVTAGSMFLGQFNPFAAMEDPMKTTEFGIMYDKEPTAVTGFYKYTPGKDFYTSEGLHGTLDPTRKDACSISAVLYEVTNADGMLNHEVETLDGNTIYQSEKIYATAMFTNDQVVSEYTPFELKLNYIKAYDATKHYKLAVIFAASKDGATYNAAIGSVLLIDEVEIISK